MTDSVCLLKPTIQYQFFSHGRLQPIGQYLGPGQRTARDRKKSIILLRLTHFNLYYTQSLVYHDVMMWRASCPIIKAMSHSRLIGTTERVPYSGEGSSSVPSSVKEIKF